MSSTEKGPRVVAIVQARMGSTRLPGKTLEDLCGESLLGRILQRVRASRTVDDLVVATTTEDIDEPIVEAARTYGAGVYRGSVHDVLSRFYEAAKAASADIIVRITADDPFKDPGVIDLIVTRLLDDERLDYASNTIEPSYPEGIDIEVFRFSALERACREATLTSDREHVTPYIWRQPELFRIENVKHPVDLSKLRWTIDYPEDLTFAREVYSRLGDRGIFSMDDILRLLESEPHLSAINQGIERNESYNRLVQKEAEETGGGRSE